LEEPVFVREDWTVFRNVNTISQKAGVPQRWLRRLVVKEVVDNALDATGGKKCRLTKPEPDTYVVSDDGPGIPGGEDFIATLFSIRRPLTSSKLVRLPTRGALGNGLRVVAGAVLATGGSLAVTTRGVEYTLQPRDDGTTEVLRSKEVGGRPGTTVLVRLPGLPADANDLFWGEEANTFRVSRLYSGRTNAHWYDSDSFFELVRAAGEMPPAQLAAMFEGWGAGAKCRPAEEAARGLPPACETFDREAADVLLGRLREGAKQLPAKQVGGSGSGGGLANGYATRAGYIEVAPGRGKYTAVIPYVVEAWAQRMTGKDADDEWRPFVNGTPVAAEVSIRRDKPTEVAVFGCGLSHGFSVAKPKSLFCLNVISPHVPITNDGKSPDFRRYFTDVSKCLTGAARKLKSIVRKEDQPESQRDVVLRSLRGAIRLASGDGRYRYSLRQLFYAVRPAILEAYAGKELAYEYFSQVVGQYESENGDLPGMYRDPRGNLYHPHTGETIPVGTVAVEEYRKPAWTFNKVLYCEKEGFVNMLVAAGWPERHDCALLSSKGFASRAVRDVIDLMGEGEEEILFFCIHDADASGTLIYQALQEETVARPSRSVKIINLGLDPWEALEMGLAEEVFERKGGRRTPVARYVREAGEDPPDGFEDWEDWLQGRRVELNAMTSPQFISWLDEKMGPYDWGKVVPPEEVLQAEARRLVREEARRVLAERILREAGIDRQVQEVVGKIRLDRELAPAVCRGLSSRPEARWIAPLASAIQQAVEQVKD
jgi:hypothetical protein